MEKYSSAATQIVILNPDIYPCDDLDNDGECNNDDILYLSKHLHPLYITDFVYPTIGLSGTYEYNYYNKRGISLSGMYLIDNDRYANESDSNNHENAHYYLFDIELFSKNGYMIKQLDEFSLYFHRNFSLSEAEDNNENIMLGARLDFKLSEIINLKLDLQTVHYDTNQDAEVNNVTSISSHLTYNIAQPTDIIKRREQRKVEKKFILFDLKHNFGKDGAFHEFLKRINPFNKKEEVDDEV